MSKKKIKKEQEGDRVLLEFANKNQAKAFFNWFKYYGFNNLQDSDSISDELSQDEFYNGISADEYPGVIDESTYFIQIE